MKSIKLILFDLDGVVVDSMPVHARAWQLAFNDIGINLNNHDIFTREGMSGLSSVRDLFITKRIQPPDDEKINRIIDKKHSYFNSNEIRVFPEIYEILNGLSQKGMTLGLVTGSHRSTVDEILPPDIIEYFKIIITSDDVINGKPHPESYLKAVGKAAGNPQQTLVIENAPMGIRSAKAAGLTCLAVATTLGIDYLTEADLVFKDHGLLKKYFDLHL